VSFLCLLAEAGLFFFERRDLREGKRAGQAEGISHELDPCVQAKSTGKLHSDITRIFRRIG